MSEVSTLHTSSAYLNHSSSPSDSDNTPLSARDPAQFLRQAALSSRKLKRRRLDATTASSIASFSRPSSLSYASSSSISLDYGQEDSSPSAPTSSEQPTAPTTTTTTTPPPPIARRSPPRTIIQPPSSGGPVPQPPLDDDASMREEGEISENEDPPFRQPERLIPAPPPTTAPEALYATKLESSGLVQSRSPYVLASRSPSVKAEDAYLSLPSASASAWRPSADPPPPVAPETQTSSESFRLDYELDANHVRPRLFLTQKQYDTAKDVILDILGYGVPPEYLVDCGLSREIIYYVFTELNLRLPSNLDIAGIPPYPPSLDMLAPILMSQSHPPSPSAIKGTATLDDDTALPGPFGYPISSSRPLDSVSNATRAMAVASLDELSTLALSESTLSAIERQRKQELLARKAVQASRKRKEPVSLLVTQASTSPTSTVSTGADASAQPSASAVSVEDFLNSIGPSLSGSTSPRRDSRAAEASGFVKVSSPEPMSIDEFIPGFGRDTFPGSDQPGPVVDRISVPPPSEDPSLPRSASASERGLSVERDKDSHVVENMTTRSGSVGHHSKRDGEPESRRSSFTTPQPAAPIPRRGSKRPVAADFDSETTAKVFTPPVLSRAGSSAGGVGYGSAYHPNPHVRRKMNGAAAGGFASLNSVRRCVIDVSDSEDDTSEDETPPSAGAHRGSEGQVVSQLTAGDSALALEQEIERMRKMIREREEMKLRKQAMTSTRTTPLSRESPAVDRASQTRENSTGVEIARSETGNNQSTKNVLASTTNTPSSPRFHGNTPSPISSTPSPSGLSPQSSFQDSSVVVYTSSTDQSATPAEGNQTVGGQALPAEPRQESAASSRASTPSRSTQPILHEPSSEDGTERESFDVIALVHQASGHSQVKANSFTAYNSVLSPYPFLSGRSLGPQEQVDLRRLRMEAAARYITENKMENARICQFEVPGFGECRDTGCGDMHLSQVQLEPNDDVTAEYLCGDQDVARLVEALQASRTRRPGATFDERVTEVWASTRNRDDRWIQATSLDKKT